MQLIAATAALFMSAALAAPQGTFTFSSPPPFTITSTGSDTPVDYRGACTCAIFNTFSPDLGKAACDSLNKDYPNVQWIPYYNACVDANNVGIDPQGFTDSCKTAIKSAYGPQALFGFDLSLYVSSSCTPSS